MMEFDQVGGDGEAEADAACLVAGRKRLEEAPPHLGRHPGPVVGDLQDHRAHAGQRPDDHLALLVDDGDGLDRVHDQVEDHLAD
jgi:hypothetical protein